MSGQGTRAAVDVGTNSVRLLVVDGDGVTLERRMEITRLGRGVDRAGRFDDAALEATLATLDSYRRCWERHGATVVRVAATSAVRDAADRDRFFAGAADRTGTEVEVLTGEDEAATAYAGAVAALEVPQPASVLDIGGGSTEIIVGDGHGGLAASVSLQLGCVRLAERCLPSDPATDDELSAARREAGRILDAGIDELRAAGADPSRCASLVGVAGTVTTLAALHLGLDAYEPDRIHATRLPAGAVRELTDRLAAMPAAARAELGPMAPGREDVIVAGAVVLEVALGRFGAVEVVASEADILEGLVLGMA